MLKGRGDEFIIIYRQHPGEDESEELSNYVNSIPGFYAISDYSAEQWLMVSDKILTVTSTFISEAYFAKKDAIVLRPIESIPAGLDSVIFDQVKSVSTYYEFCERLDNNRVSSMSGLEKYYSVKENVLGYIRCVDSLEKIYNDNHYNLIWDKKELKTIKRISIHQRLLYSKGKVTYYIKKPIKVFIHIFINLVRTKNKKSSCLVRRLIEIDDRYVNDVELSNKYTKNDSDFCRIKKKIKFIVNEK